MALAEGLRAYWKLDETSTGNIQDSSTNGYIGVPQNSPTQGITGIIGSCVQLLDASNQFFAVSKSVNISGACTISCWVKQTDWGNRVFISNRQGANRWQFGCDGDAGNLTALFWGLSDEDHAAGNNTCKSGAWQHAVVTYDGAKVWIWSDSTNIYSGAATGNIATGSGNTTLGSDSPAASNELNGLLDDVRIWDRALTGAEIEELYRLGMPVVLPDPSNKGTCGTGDITNDDKWTLDLPDLADYDKYKYGRIKDPRSF